MSWFLPCKDYPFLLGTLFKITVERAQGTISPTTSSLFAKFEGAYRANKESKCQSFVGIGMGRLFYDVTERWVNMGIGKLLDGYNKNLSKKLMQTVAVTILMHPMKAHITSFTIQPMGVIKSLRDPKLLRKLYDSGFYLHSLHINILLSIAGTLLNYLIEEHVSKPIIESDLNQKRALDPNSCTFAQFVDKIRSNSTKYILLSAGSAYSSLLNELLVTTLIFPLYTCFVRLSAHPDKYPQGIWNVLKKDGIASLYKGSSVHGLFVGLTLASMIIFCAILYVVTNNENTLKVAYDEGRTRSKTHEKSVNQQSNQ